MSRKNPEPTVEVDWDKIKWILAGAIIGIITALLIYFLAIK